ncbi:copper chaperone PCu(A)C [Ramlibacter sp.]|uniref:copper chaperone PCu(A)C n=1 Tax=Ramlibacter sp. TaxID=1917967 RepID=UPI002B5B4430|nr:copper chaperone PCu(A)C [Ramlibacter sp.]HWI82784.1 copper chaperone PCu(A)C [Ramlibacter sp.]
MTARRRRLLFASCLVAWSALAQGASAAAPAAAEAGPPPRVEAAWVRSAVAGQQGTGAFMKITAPRPMQLVAAETPVAGTAEVHEMKLEGDVMKMRAIAQLELPAGRTIELRPGGHHLMLMDLKQGLPAGSIVPLTLVFRDGAGAQSRVELKVPVAIKPPAAGAAHGAVDSHKH